MTGDNMKSELLGGDRLKIESRQSLHRRKMSKNLAVLNGLTDHAVDEDNMVRQVNLAAAFHDHISCTKSADLCKLQESKSDRVNLPCETDHIYANCSDVLKTSSSSGAGGDDGPEVQRMKDLVLLHTDLIKHQQEQLLKKDRQLQALKEECDSLKARLERTVKKLSIPKQKQEKEDAALLEKSCTTQSTQTDRMVTGLPPSLPQTSSASSSKADGTSRPSRFVGRPRKRYSTSQSPVPTSSQKSHSRAASADNSASNRSNSSQPVAKRPLRGGKGSSAKHEGILRTDEIYLINETHQIVDVPSQTDNIEVPSWRLHPVTSAYQMEGTENIEDETFDKRHSKLEQDEKRRKRWDVQRLREQKKMERLLRRQKASVKNDPSKKDDLSSFFWDVKNVQLIEVSETLPVIAFGHAIPSFHPSEFSLPWFDMEEREKQEQQGKLKKRSYANSRRGT